MFDPDRYRSKDEIEAWKRHDPIPALRTALTAARQLTDADYEALEAEVAASSTTPWPMPRRDTTSRSRT